MNPINLCEQRVLLFVGVKVGGHLQAVPRQNILFGVAQDLPAMFTAHFDPGD